MIKLKVKINNFVNKIFQVKQYNWLSDDLIDKCMNRLDKLNLSNNINFETLNFLYFNFNNL